MSFQGKKITGTIVPMVTPLSTPETLDLRGLENMINFEINGGGSVIFILGSTGEGPALPWDLRRELVRESVRLIAGRVPLFVNISCDSASESLRFAKYCEENGADAVVLSPACYLPNNDEELVDYYKGISSQTKLPLYVYNMPELTKVSISMHALETILELPGIAGIKDSSGNMEFFRELVGKFRDREDLSIFMGPDALTQQALSLGADGGVNSGANIRPDAYSGLYKAMKSGDRATADACQKEIMKVQELYQVRAGSPGVFRGLKKALAAKGLIQNIVAFPGSPA